MKSIKDFVLNCYTGLPRTKAIYCALCILIYLMLAAQSGAHIWQFPLFCLILLFYILLPGRFISKLFGMDQAFPLFRFPAILVGGVGFLTVLYCFCMRIGFLYRMLWILPLVISAFELFRIYQEHKADPAKALKRFRLSDITPNGWLLVLLFSTLVLVYTFSAVVKNAHPAAVDELLLSQDFLWNVGNARSFAMAFPPQDIRFYNVRLTYHYLTEMIAGILALISGIPAYDIVGMYLTPMVLLALISCLYLFARFLYRDKPLPVLLSTFSMFLFSCASLWYALPNGRSLFNNTNLEHVITNSNAQATAILFLCCYAGLFLNAARQQFRVGFRYLLFTVGAFILLTVGKGPVAAIVAIASVLTVLFLVFQKKAGIRGVLLSVAVLGSFFLLYKLLFSSGANSSVAFSISETLERGPFAGFMYDVWCYRLDVYYLLLPVLYVVQTILSVPAQSLLYISSLWYALKNLFHLDADHLFLHACTAGGLLAYYLFSHPHFSQLYFLLLAVFCINMLACGRLDALNWHKAEQSRHPAVRKVWICTAGVLCTIGVLSSGFFYIHLVGSGILQFGRNLGLLEKYDYYPTVSVMIADDENAANWLYENTSKDDMFATNRIHTGIRREGLSNVYSALSGRQAFMEGYQYAETNMGVDLNVIQHRLEQNTALFDKDSSKEEILEICQEHGITYLLYSLQQSAVTPELAELHSALDDALQQYFPCVYENQSCRIYATGVQPIPRS